MAGSSDDQKRDKYRSFLDDEGEKNTRWSFGAPPNYDVVDKLFEEGQTKVWPAGSLGEKVQNLVKTFEMEIFHKASPEDYKSFDPMKLTLSLNGRKSMSVKEVGMIGGGYNFFMQTALPDPIRIYDPAHETADSSHREFTTTFPRGFALEVLEVYTGPPQIVFKFRHWGYMEGPFKGHAPTGEMVELFGIGIYEVDKDMRIVKIDYFYDRGELLGGLIKGSASPSSVSCPLLRNTG
ncbi:hypothetical protein SAY86_019562 [Trapa natans]|uniref:Pathogen-related protein n=1 Tax=Trapa natans TaxID=22666 RepID=A0AAN7LXR9_TRANT|nr:hypothetical protein SAY86_019562 [Trapa natans]